MNHVFNSSYMQADLFVSWMENGKDLHKVAEFYMERSVSKSRQTDTRFCFKKRWQIAKVYNEHKLAVEKQQKTDTIIKQCRDTTTPQCDS